MKFSIPFRWLNRAGVVAFAAITLGAGPAPKPVDPSLPPVPFVEPSLRPICYRKFQSR